MRTERPGQQAGVGAAALFGRSAPLITTLTGSGSALSIAGKLYAPQEFSKGLVRPDPLLYQGFLRVGRPGKSAYNQGRRKSLLGYFSNAFC